MRTNVQKHLARKNLRSTSFHPPEVEGRADRHINLYRDKQTDR